MVYCVLDGEAEGLRPSRRRGRGRLVVYTPGDAFGGLSKERSESSVVAQGAVMCACVRLRDFKVRGRPASRGKGEKCSSSGARAR